MKTRVSPLVLIVLLALVTLSCRAASELGQSGTPTQVSEPIPSPLVILPTASATSTPTPLPTATPQPAVRIDTGDEMRFQGDWESALTEYQAALLTSPDSQIQGAALLGTGRTRCLSGDTTGGIETLSTLITTLPDSPQLPEANFALAQCLEFAGRYSEAADAYLSYLTMRSGVIDAYVLVLRGDALRMAGRYGEALNDFRAALNSPGLIDHLAVEIKVGNAHAAVGDYGTALGIYQDIYQRTNSDFTRAQLDLFMGQTYTAMGQVDQAYAVYKDAVNNFPRSYDSYSALLALVEAGVAVDELNRGIVDFYAGQYGVALAAFDRYLQAGGVDAAAAYYYMGLSYRALGNYAEALAPWERVINGFPEHRFWDDAWEQKAYTQWFYLDDYDSAIQALRNFVIAAPAHPRAAEFLFDAALVAERDEQLTLGIELWEQMAAAYPGDERFSRAIFLSGITRFRLADFDGAFASMQKLLEVTESMQERTAAYLWMGKVRHAQGDAASAQASWELGASLDPTGYYSERARDILQNRPPFTPPEQYDLGSDPEHERLEAETWLRTTFALDEGTDLSSPGPLAQDARFQRGATLWELGLFEEGRAEFEDLRLSLQQSPVDNYRLARYFLSIGSYRQAILCARQVLNLAGMGDAQTLGAPAYLNHIRFGSYYSNLIIPNAIEYGFHPLFLFSVVRQESAFEGFVRSSAGARGLMQIIPATGDEIAQELDWPPDYSSADLFRPQVSVRLGAHYLAKWRDQFRQPSGQLSPISLYAALAAYNGGPGNAMAWHKLAQDDPDLFVELVRFEETRNYIRGIYEIFSIYRRLYDRTP